MLSGKVEVIEISPSNTADLPRGKEADGIIGDFVLRNSKIEVTIGGKAPNRKANMGAFWGPNGVTGCLYDLTLRHTNNDQLTIFFPSKQQGKVSYVKIGEDNKSVIAFVSQALSGGLTKTHTYTLAEEEYGITITSRLLNATQGKFLVQLMTVGRDLGESGKFDSIEWADAVDPSHKCGYAYAWLPDKEGRTLLKPKLFAPGEEVIIRRYLTVGTSP